MGIVSDIELRIRADIARLQNDMNAARRAVDNGLGGIARTVSTVKTALGGLAAGFAVKELLGKVIEAQREFDKLNASLETATGSTANAAQAFAALQKFAATTPFSVAEATEAFIKLRNQGLNPSEAALRSYGNTASGANKSLDQFIEAVADASRSQFERLQEFAIAAKQNGSLVTFTFQGLSKTVGNNSKEIQEYLQSIGNVQFAGAMEKQANTLNGAVGNLSDTWQSFLRTVAQSGVGGAAQTAVVQLAAAIGDLGDILDIATSKADAEGKKIGEIGAIHSALTTVFEALSVTGINIAYIFEEIGKEIGAASAALFQLAKGDLKGALAIAKERQKQEDIERAAVDAKSDAILNASKKRQAAQTAETNNLKSTTGDQLGQYEIVLTAEQKRAQAIANVTDTMNRLNGTNAQTAGELKKLKEAYDTGGITLAQYNKFVSQINKETALSSTAYKDSVKAIDLSAAAIQRRAAAQAFANQRAQENLDFLKRTGQLNEEDYIKKSADADIKALQDAKTALEATRDLEARKIDNRVKVMDLNGQIDEQERKIAARRAKTGQDEFELEQKLYREAVNNTADLIEAAQAEAKTQKDRTRDMQDEIDMLGLTGKQIAEVTAARLRDQAAALDRRAEIGIIEEVNDALRAQADELRKQADLGLTKERVQEQQKFWGDIEQTAHDTFVSIADGGKGAFQRLKDSAKNIFFEWLYQMTLKKWIVNIGTSVDGASSAAGIANGSSGLLSLLGAGGSAGGLGTGFLGSLAGGLNGAGAGAPLGSAMGLQIGNAIRSTVGDSVSSGLASALKFAPQAGAAIASYMLAKTISGGYKIEGIGNLLNFGGVIGGLANRAFGMGSKQYADSSTLAGTLGSGGFNGSINTAWTQKGGWFRSNKSGTDKAAVDAVLASGLVSTYDAIKTATKGYADVLGLNAASIANRTQTLNIALGKDEAANQKAIADFFAGVSDTIAAEVLPSISQFQAAGETASTTLQRLATDFAGVTSIMAAVGVDASKAFNLTGVAAIEARERLVTLAGGLDALATQTQYFAENFQTAADKIGPLQQQVVDQLMAVGRPDIRTMTDFEAAVQGLVSSGALATESGAKLYASLLALAPQFKQMSDLLKEINQAAVDSAMGALSRAVNAQKDIVTEAYNEAMTALDARIDDVNGTIERTARISQALKEALVGIDTPQAAEVSRQVAQAQVTAFLAVAKAGGALPDYDQLQAVVSSLKNDATGSFSNLADYQRSVARTNAELEQLGGLTDGQLSTAQKQLALLQDQKTIAQSAYEAEIARLDGLVTTAQAQLDVLNGVDNSIISVEAAVAGVQAVLLSMASPGAQISNSNGAVLSNALDALGIGLSLFRRLTGSAVPTDNSTVQSGTMSSSAADTADLAARLLAMEESMAATARATEKLADQFNQVSGGGQYLLVDQA